MATEKPTAEESFRSSLQDLLIVVEKLAPLCESPADMLGMIRLAVGDESTPGNDAQLRLLYRTVVVLMKNK